MCGGEGHDTVLVGRDLVFRRPGTYPVVRCQGCQLEYVTPRPTPEALGAHYPDDYFGYQHEDNEPAWLRPLLRNMRRDIELRRIKYLEEAIGPITEGLSLLDVGCGPNSLLATIRDERGVTGTGLDFKAEVVEHVRQTLGMPMVQGTLHDAAFEAGRFDAVMMMEYLEHEPDPLGVLGEARRVTRTGGHVVLELPHIAGGPGRFFGPNWWNLDVPRHLVFFTPDTLKDALSRTGYELVHLKTFSFPFYIGNSVLQRLGMRNWSKYRRYYAVLGGALGFPFVPFVGALPEFMFAVGRAR